MLKFYRLFIAAVTLLLQTSSAISANVPHWQDSQYIERSFYDIALQNEYDNKQTRVRKWVKPLRIYVDHQVGENELHLKLLKMHLSQLHKITALPMQFVKNKSQANVIVFITRSSQVNSIISSEISPESIKPLRNAVCLANFKKNNNNEITRALVIIPVDRARMHGKLISCFVEELTQILGLPNDSKMIHPTIFSDRNIYKLLTGLDYILLKLLYSAEIKAGMTKAELKPKIQQILNQWQQDGTIKNAQKEVVKGELYELLGYR